MRFLALLILTLALLPSAAAQGVFPVEIEHYRSYAARADSGRTSLRVVYSIPRAAVSGAAEGADSLRLRLRATLRSMSGQPVAEEELLATLSSDRGFVLTHQLQAPPDSYVVALEAFAEDAAPVAAQRFGRRLPDFNTHTILLSDLVLAQYFRELRTPAHRLDDLALAEWHERAPYHAASRQPLIVAFEVYNLTPDADGRACYEVAYTLTPERRRGLRLRSRNPVTLAYQRCGEVTGTVEVGQIDVRALASGSYQLDVRVTDVASGIVATRSERVEWR